MKFSDLLKYIFSESAASSAIANQALEFAKEKHSGQKRRSGDDYIIHPKRVAKHVSRFKQSHRLSDLIAAAYLHDTVEDTDTSIQEIAEKFGDLVASLVSELTSDKTEIRKQGKTKYMIDKLLKMSDWGLVIKLADRLDNVSDLKNADEKFREKYKKETNEILEAISKDRRLTGSQQKITNQIRKKLALLS